MDIACIAPATERIIPMPVKTIQVQILDMVIILSLHKFSHIIQKIKLTTIDFKMTSIAWFALPVITLALPQYPV